MSNEEIIISRAIELAEPKLVETTKELRIQLKELLYDEAKKIYQQENLSPDMLAERLDGLITRINKVFQKKKTNQQSMIDWIYIQPNATYYQNRTSQKIAVNVINDDRVKNFNGSKSNYKQQQLDNKLIYSPSNAIIGSRTIEDLFQVIQNQRTTSPINERVIIIDDYKPDPPTPIPQQSVYYTYPNYVPFYFTPFVYFGY